MIKNLELTFTFLWLWLSFLFLLEKETYGKKMNEKKEKRREDEMISNCLIGEKVMINCFFYLFV